MLRNQSVFLLISLINGNLFMNFDEILK